MITSPATFKSIDGRWNAIISATENFKIHRTGATEKEAIDRLMAAYEEYKNEETQPLCQSSYEDPPKDSSAQKGEGIETAKKENL